MQTPSYIDTRFLLESISHDFAKLLDDGLNHDIEFTCGDQSIKAHKDILCSRSDVFASMLQSDMVEGKTGRVNIQDVDAPIFQQFLKCLYTGILPELTIDAAVQFYKTSDKYAVDTLRKQCADFLTDNLCRENACDVLVLADRHSDSDLKKNVMEYVFKEKIPIVGENWVDFCKENPVLAVEVLNSFCQHQHLSTK